MLKKGLKSLTITDEEYKCYVVAYYGQTLVKAAVQASRQTLVSLLSEESKVGTHIAGIQ